MVVIGIDTHGNATLSREMKGIEEQLCEHDKQMMAIGLDGKHLGQLTV